MRISFLIPVLLLPCCCSSASSLGGEGPITSAFFFLRRSYSPPSITRLNSTQGYRGEHAYLKSDDRILPTMTTLNFEASALRPPCLTHPIETRQPHSVNKDVRGYISCQKFLDLLFPAISSAADRGTPIRTTRPSTASPIRRVSWASERSTGSSRRPSSTSPPKHDDWLIGRDSPPIVPSLPQEASVARRQRALSGEIDSEDSDLRCDMRRGSSSRSPRRQRRHVRHRDVDNGPDQAQGAGGGGQQMKRLEDFVGGANLSGRKGSTRVIGSPWKRF